MKNGKFSHLDQSAQNILTDFCTHFPIVCPWAHMFSALQVLGQHACLLLQHFHVISFLVCFMFLHLPPMHDFLLCRFFHLFHLPRSYSSIGFISHLRSSDVDLCLLPSMVSSTISPAAPSFSFSLLLLPYPTKLHPASQ